MADYEGVKSNFSEEEINRLERIHRGCCFTNSLVDFHESDDEEDDDGSTVFAYTETLRYM